MRSLKEYFRNENNSVIDSYIDKIARIKEIIKETDELIKKDSDKNNYYVFFNHTAKLIMKLSKIENEFSDDYFSKNSFDMLMAINNELFMEIKGINYEKSYANPEYCVSVFGDSYGQLISYFYTIYRKYIEYAYSNKIFKMEEYNRLFIDVYKYINEDDIDYAALKALITSHEKQNLSEKKRIYYKENFDKEIGYYNDIIRELDITDLRYLFRFGLYISDNEIKTAQFLNKYSEEKMKKLSKTIAKAMINGYIVDQKDRKNRTAVKLMYNLGYERLIRFLIEDLKKYGIDAFVSQGMSTAPNKQFEYDHRFDTALYLDEEYVNMCDEANKEACEKTRDILLDYTGILYFDKFGEIPFVPKNKSQCLKLSEEQQKLNMILSSNYIGTLHKYVPEEERSFCIIGFPTPEIGERFEEIFEDILEINMLDSDKYMGIQKNIIDILDKADYVHVKGVDGNKTNIMVKMHEIKDNENETNFFNCGADVNIPVGEVFTSPLLTGTNGTLHVKDIYLNDLRFLDLVIEFKDGYIADYSCSNFKDEAENKKYIEENLLFPHKTLPIGEFAIGTNTLAYSVAKKYEILDKMPILIIEKMGPHFAIGDTCFSRDEDRVTKDILTGKKIIAKDNEKSAKRNENPQEAYTNIHTDITLPYESLKSIEAVTRDGRRLSIIENGRFVFEGSEELNKYL